MKLRKRKLVPVELHFFMSLHKSARSTVSAKIERELYKETSWRLSHSSGILPIMLEALVTNEY